jgi:hypothetical protein
MRSLLVWSTLGVAALLAGCTATVDMSDGEKKRGPLENSTETIALDGAEKTRVELRMGAGELRMSGGAAQLMEGNFRYAGPGMKPVVRHTRNESRSVVTIDQPTGMHIGNDGDMRWDIKLNDKQATDIVAHLGAGEANLNFSSMNLRDVEVHMGVGELNLDLRGKPQHDYDVEVHGGVGEATILLPKDAAIEADVKGGIGDISVRGLEKRNGKYINPAQVNAPITIRLDIAGGVGQINLRAE